MSVDRDRQARRIPLGVLRIALCILLLAAGAALRLTHINWDQYQHVHPDERFIVWVADSVSAPASLAEALDPARSTINPFRWPPDAGDQAGKSRSYAYGHFPLYLLVITAHLAQAGGAWLGETPLALPAAFQPLNTIGRHLAEYNYLALVGRVISTLADLGTLLLVYALAKRISKGSTLAGFLAAGAYAFAVLPIQLSHFYAVDQVLTFCVVATVALAARCADAAHKNQAGRIGPERQPAILGTSMWGAWLAAGAMAGLAVGSKFSAVLLILPLLVAAFYGLPAGNGRSKAAALLGRMALALGAGIVVFVVTNPFAVIEPFAYASNILAQNAMVSGFMDAPYTRQYIGTAPYLYFVRQISQWGLGWPLGVVAWGGFVWALARAGLRRGSPALVVMVAWALPYFALTGSFHTKFLRYMAPLLPFLLAFGAAAAVSAYGWVRGRWGRRGTLTWGLAVAAVAGFTVAWALAFTGIYREDHPWIAASRWIYSNAPDGAKLLTEQWDDALPLTMDEIPGRPPLRSYSRVELPLWDADSAAKADRLAAELSSADYVIIASNRLYAPIGRLAARYPMASRYYRMLFAGELGYRQVAEFSDYPRLGNLVIPDDHADESFTVYDHPRVFIFANTERLSQAQLRARLGRYLAERGPVPNAVKDVLARMTGQPVKRHCEGSEAISSSAREIASALRRLAMTASPDARLSARAPGHASYLPSHESGAARDDEEPPAPAAPAAAALTLSQPVDTLPVVADFRWDKFASEWPPAAILLWWLVLSVFGWAVWPLLYPLLGGLRDRGYGLARAAGWLIVGWMHWIGVNLGLWQNRVAPVAALLAMLALAGILAGWAQRRTLAAFRAERRGLLLGEEVLFALAFLAFVGIRLLNPDLWQPWNGGEKFMEFAFLNATLRSAQFPPYDPYFAGGTLNYYYYGLYLVSLPIKLTGIYPEVAFNLAVPGLFALTAVALFSVGYSLAPGGVERRTGLLSVGLALLMGNLAGFAEWLRTAAALGGGTLDYSGSFTFPVLAVLRGLGRALAGAAASLYNYWWPSRVIPFSINEFPLWTFLFADLHPHMIAMPFGMLVVGLVLNLWHGNVSENVPDKSGTPESSTCRGVFRSAGRPVKAIARAGLIILSLGALGVINTWDLPTYSVLLFAALLLKVWRDLRNGPLRRGTPPTALLGVFRLSAAALGAVAAVVLAMAAYLPFYAHYQAQVGKGDQPLLQRYVGLVDGASPIGPWLLVWGFFLFLAIGFTLRGWTRSEGRGQGVGATGRSPLLQEAGGGSVPWEPGQGVAGRGWLVGLLGLVALVALLFAVGKPTAALLAVPLVLAIARALRPDTGATDAFLSLVLALGLGIVFATELVYLRDFLDGGDWRRMNTLFKFYVPAWLFLGLAAAVMLPTLWSTFGRRSAWLAVPLRALTVALLAAGLVFVPLGIPSRVRDRFPGAQPAIGTLDGTAFMTVGSYQWPDADHTIVLAYDYTAIHWLLDHVTGTPVLAEAPAGAYEIAGLGPGSQPQGFDYYRAGGQRAASLTGLPTFVGHHQYEQRPGDQVGRQLELGLEFFRTTDLARGRELIAELRVGYIYVGTLERIVFPEDGLRKFDVLVELGDLEVAYRNPEVTIYRTLGEG